MDQFFFEKRELPVKITDEQRAELQKRNADIDIELQVAAEEFERAKGIHKGATEPIKKEKVKNLSILRTGVENKVVNVYEYVNEEEATLEFYDETSQLVHARALTIDERRQHRIPFNRKRLESAD
ncbi:hypothetical protein GCM10028806_28210 [Spirosoma terrae]|uniref:Uncharacterized protein n=1 Tax=Spirosoma terrae TaxID=1968276 RepID=A0A6L9LCC2_9BACT|nr:hypothetical protein [Spirosoma terrae]NDU97217.1 hypothetical protein [Spirosoma terrae]